MGIPGLWDILGDGELTSIAALSAQHYQKTGRPFRVAIDEAGWRFANLTDAQVVQIRAKSTRESNPIEKAIFYRLSKLLRNNVQPIFVTDGPGRPWKRGKRGGGKVDHSRTALLVKMLDKLAIPHHRAPAEAEAECARMNQAGIVDAVWSDDSDTLMFGATMLINEHRQGGTKRNGAKKSDTHVHVYRACDIKARHGLDATALVAFAILSGGDYDQTGLRGCGPHRALEAVRFGNGLLGQKLMELRGRNLPLWTELLADVLLSIGHPTQIPPDFPRPLVVENYCGPKVSTVDQLYNLNGLRKGWERSINEAALRVFMRECFNFWARAYIIHIVPILLVQKLRRGLSDHERTYIALELAKKKKVKRHPDDPKCVVESTCETVVTFLPNGVSALDLALKPIEEDWDELETKTRGRFDPLARVEVDVLDFLLDSGLGADRSADLRAGRPAPTPAASKPIAPIPKTLDPSQTGSSATTGAKGLKRSASDIIVPVKSASKRNVKSLMKSVSAGMTQFPPLIHATTLSLESARPRSIILPPDLGADFDYDAIADILKETPLPEPPVLSRGTSKASSSLASEALCSTNECARTRAPIGEALSESRGPKELHGKQIHCSFSPEVIDLTLD